MEEISSLKNNLIKEVKKLHKKKERQEQQAYLIEGFHLVEEAINYQGNIQKVFTTKKHLAATQALLKNKSAASLYVVTDEIIKSLSMVPAPQGVIAVVEIPKASQEPALTCPILILDNVQDPGNLGTMIRTADAANFKTVILGAGTVDSYNDKVLRSMQGSQFHLNIIEADLSQIIPTLRSQGVTVYGTELNPKAVSYRELPRNSEIALMMGNEGQGVAPELLQLTDANVYIPITGKAESLNVAVAAGVLMFALT
ncbi:TrmH family RNA methyltransferase [Vagococcus salmoninarum]|uniref:TrmH family RNA methyltransferase n=1 Tax=Vagococcus salmoninarum TaxID=2739 RepID=UPI003F9D8A43